MGYVLILMVALLGTVYVLVAQGRVDSWPQERVKMVRNLFTLLIVLLGIYGIMRGSVGVLALTVFILIPIVRNLLSPKAPLGEKERTQIMADMTRAEALRILELDEDEATPEAIDASYKRIMRVVHPDQGGTTYFAAKLNAARDYLAQPASQAPREGDN